MREKVWHEIKKYGPPSEGRPDISYCPMITFYFENGFIPVLQQSLHAYREAGR